MPWCDGCDRFYNPSSLAMDGTCKECGAFIASPDDEPDRERSGRAPWHFYVLMVALVVYLGWRLIQGIGWVVTHI
ncbi:MAG TPA: hypothetical protein VEW93_04360 [Acidimicrobiales bacterium]|nr:hypothetical protein [Acidimicrobiales bacterium]